MGSVGNAIDRVIGHIENTILFLGLLTALSVTTLNVVMRYVFNSPLTWPPELARDCHILIIFIGASAAIKAGTHLKVDVLCQFFPVLRKFSDYFSCFIIMVYAVAVIWLGKNLVYMQYVTDQKSIALNIPYCILYAIPGFGAVLMIIRAILQVLSFEKENARS